MSTDFMLKEIKSFPETKDLKFEYHEITTVYQYVKLKKAFNPNDPKDLYEPILKENPIRIEYAPSLSYEKELAAQEKARNVDRSYHNEYLLDAKLEDFEVFNDERKMVVAKAKDFITSFEKKTFVKGLYIHGKNRTGKTFLLSAIVNELANKGVKSVFVYVPDLIRHIHSSIDEGLLEEKISQLKNCDLLALDDLGSAFMNRWFRDQVFGPIIQYRVSLGLPIIVSSNLNITRFETFMIDDNVKNDRFNTVRIITRIQELTTQVKLDDEQYKPFD